MLVDTHCHASSVWYEPVEALLHQMDRNRVDRAVLVQIMGQYDNDYQEKCVARFPDRLVSVPLIDPEHAEIADLVRRAADRGARGVRYRVGVLGVDGGPLCRAAAACGLPVTCGGRGFDGAEFAALIAATPEAVFILEHLAGLNTPATSDAARRSALELARFPNVYVKLHGLGEILAKPDGFLGESPPFGGPVPLLRDVLRLFGPERMMWGSDFPPVSGREGYANALSLCHAQFGDQPAAAQALIFGGVAQRVFRLT